jgi:hypothetical protein
MVLQLEIVKIQEENREYFFADGTVNWIGIDISRERSVCRRSLTSWRS